MYLEIVLCVHLSDFSTRDLVQILLIDLVHGSLQIVSQTLCQHESSLLKILCPRRATQQVKYAYLVYFRCQNFNLAESLESIVIGFAKQTDRLAAFP